MENNFDIHQWQAKFLKEESSNTKTAIEWLVQELRGYDDEGDFIFHGVINSELISQAKEIEKQQIIDAYKAAEDECEYFIEEHKWNRYYETAEPYYNNKYK